MTASHVTYTEEPIRLWAKSYFRRPRMRKFAQIFSITDTTRVIDIGGTPFNWSLIEVYPRITMVNIDGSPGKTGNIEQFIGDATALSFSDNSFEIAYSNSVIEHVGGPDKIAAFAHEVRRLAPSYYVQTPNKWFPVDAHWFTLFVHWFPFSWQRRLYRHFSMTGLVRRPSQLEVDKEAASIRLLTFRDFKALFPDATILKERTLLFPFIAKSFIAIRHDPRQKKTS